MDWSTYHYLSFVAAAAAVVTAALAYLAPQLSEHQEEPHRTPLEIGSLLVVLALGLTAICGNYYREVQCFGWWDVGSDTMQQYVPYYLNLLDSIRKGTLGFWNYQYGLGTSFMSYQSWTLDPFNLVVLPLCLAFGDTYLSLALVIAQSVKVVLAGLLFDHLLVSYCHTPLARLLGSSLYAFCGYLTLWGQHYWLGGVCVVSVALLLALESLMRRWSVPCFLAVAGLSALSIITSTYVGFMVMLFAASYALVRVAHVSQCRSVGQFLRAYGALALPAVCGVMISCITLVPYALLMLGESTRVAGGADAPLSIRALAYLKSFVPKEWILPILSRLLGNSLISSGEPIPTDVIPPSATLSTINVFEFISLGLSCGALVLLLQFVHWLATEASWRDKILASLAFLFGLTYCFNAFLPALNNVFAEAKYRSSFVVDIIACTAMALAFERRVLEDRPSRPLLYLGVLGSAVVVGWSFFKTVNGRLECLAFFASLTMLALLLEWHPGSTRHRQALAVLVCLVLVGSSVLDDFFTTNRRAWSTAEDFPLAIEPNKASDTVEALAYLAQHDETFYRVEKLDYYDWTELDDCLVQGYAGVASYNSTLDSDVEEFYARLWPGVFAGDTAYQMVRQDSDHPELLTMLGVKYLLSYNGSNQPWLKEIARCGHIHIYRNKAEASVLSLRTSSMAEKVAEKDLATAEKMLSDTVIVPNEVSVALPGAKAAGVPSTVEVMQDGRALTAKAATDQPCVAVLAVPHTAGWIVSVDGRRIDTFRANYGFIGFVLEPGTHDITAHFMPRGLVLGASISLAGLVLALASCVIGRRRLQP